MIEEATIVRLSLTENNTGGGVEEAMPDLPPELALLLNTLIQNMQSMQASQEQLRQFVQFQVEKLHVDMEGYSKKEAMKALEEDIGEIRQEMKEGFEKLQKSIIENQEDRFKRTIAIQYTILSTIVIGAIGYLVQQILSSAFHH